MADVKTLRLPQNLTIRNIVTVHERLCATVSHFQDISLGIEGDSNIDLSFVQLIEAARIQASDTGKTLTLAQPATGELRAILERGGFLTSAAAEDLRFWLHA